MGLSEQTCIPCQGGKQALSASEAQEKLPAIPGWELPGDAKKLHRHFAFKNWKESIAFVNKISEIAEAEKHHPDVSFGWGYADITIQTHKIGGLHENDFILAAKISAAYAG